MHKGLTLPRICVDQADDGKAREKTKFWGRQSLPKGEGGQSEPTARERQLPNIHSSWICNIYSIHELYIVCWRLRSIVKMRDRDKSIQGIFSSPCLTQKSSEYDKSWFWKKVTEWLSLEGKTKNLYFSPWQNQHPTNFFQVKSRQFTQIHRFMPFWGSGNCEQNTN